jgi:hypothetical protein
MLDMAGPSLKLVARLYAGNLRFVTAALAISSILLPVIPDSREERAPE